jgi:hypothetical protein
MKRTTYPLTKSMTRLFSLTALVATLLIAPTIAFAKDKVSHVDQAELRIVDIHSKLKITADQEQQWAKVAQSMRDDAKIMDGLTQARVDRAKDTNAIDDLSSYAAISQAHADGIKNLTSQFAPLYTSMSDAQKLQADTLFRHGLHEQKHGKHGHHKTDNKSEISKSDQTTL